MAERVFKRNVALPKRKVGRPRKTASKDKPLEHYNKLTGKFEEEMIKGTKVYLGENNKLILRDNTKFGDVETLISRLNDYFNEGGTIVTSVNKSGDTVTKRVLTLSGLIFFLGYNSMSEFYKLESHKEYGTYIKRAKLLIQQNYEEMLQTASNPTGAIFALKQFGWKDNNNGELNINLHPFMDMMKRAQSKEQPKELIDGDTE